MLFGPMLPLPSREVYEYLESRDTRDSTQYAASGQRYYKETSGTY